MVCANLGRIVASNGEHTAALQHFSRAVELFEELDKRIGGYKSSALDNLISIGEVHYDLGDYRKALDYYGKVLLAAEERGYMNLLQSALNDMGIVYMYQAALVKASEHFTRR